MLNRSGENSYFVSDLGGKAVIFFPIEYDVHCGFEKFGLIMLR
jgi:hypothetical protein